MYRLEERHRRHGCATASNELSTQPVNLHSDHPIIESKPKPVASTAPQNYCPKIVNIGFCHTRRGKKEMAGGGTLGEHYRCGNDRDRLLIQRKAVSVH